MAKIIGVDGSLAEIIAAKILMYAVGFDLSSGVVEISKALADRGRIVREMSVANWVRQLRLASTPSAKRHSYLKLVVIANRSAVQIKTDQNHIDRFWHRMQVALFTQVFQLYYNGAADWEDVDSIIWWVQGMLSDLSLYDIACQKVNHAEETK